MDNPALKIKCAYDKLVPIDQLKAHPKNPNTHSREQIERLAKIINYQGQRSPVVVDKKTGYIVVGHGRTDAMKKLGWKEIAVNFQEFESEDQLFAHMTADNAIAEWATLDLSAINLELENLGPDLDIDMLGLKDFVIEPLDADLPDLGDGSDPDIQQVTFTISNEQKDFLDEAMEKAKGELDCTDKINKNQNGNILGAIMRHYVNS